MPKAFDASQSNLSTEVTCLQVYFLGLDVLTQAGKVSAVINAALFSQSSEHCKELDCLQRSSVGVTSPKGNAGTSQ